MASPAIAQHRPTALAAAATSISGTWSGNTTAGDRLLAIIAIEANGQSNVPITPADTTWKIRNPGRIVRQSAGVDELVVVVYEMVNAPQRLAANAEVFNFGASVFGTLELIRVTGADLTNSDAVTPTSFSGNGLTFTISAPPTPTIDALAIAVAVNGNPTSTQTQTWGTLQDDVAPGTTGTDRERMGVFSLAVAANAPIAGATITLSGATNRNEAGIMIVIPSPAVIAADPAIVQSVHVAEAFTTAVTALDIPWDVPTTVGNRLMLFVAENDGTVGAGATVGVPAAWGAPIGPGKLTRVSGGADVISGQIYEILNAAARSGNEHITFSKAVFPFVALVELANTHTATAIDRSAGASGSGTALDSGATTATTITDGIAIGFGANTSNVSLTPDPSFTPIEAGGSPSSGSTKIGGGVFYKPISVAGIQDFLATINGGTSRSWVGFVLAIPAATQSSGGGGGGGGGAGVSPYFPNFDDGRLHRCINFHYTPGYNLSSLAIAQQMAAKYDCCVASYSTNGGQYNDRLPDVYAVKPAFRAGFYGKSAQHAGLGSPNMPDSYFAHTAGGAKITTFSASIYVMQPGDVANASYADTRGFTALNFKDWTGKDRKWIVDHENGRHAGTINTVDLDSMGTSSFKGTQVSPTDAHTYTSAQWIALIRGLGDEVKAAVGPNVMVVGNGLTSGPNYQGAAVPTKGLMDHVDCGVAENWIRNNFANVTTFYTEAQWKASIDMCIDVNVTRKKAAWLIVNIANYTAASAPAGWTPPTTAQLDRWIRLSVVTTYLGQRGATMLEFVADSRDDPFALDHVYFNQRLGLPLQSELTAAAMKYNTGEPYTRKFTNGLCLANYQAAGNLTFTADRDYKDPVTNAAYATGSSIVLTPNTALILLTTAVGTPNASGPQVTWNSPSSSVGTTPQTVQVTITDPDGVAIPSTLKQDGVSIGAFSEIGSGTTTRVFQKTGVAFVDGVPSALSFTVADNHATPLTTTASKQVTYNAPVVLTPPPTPPPPTPPPKPKPQIGDFASHIIDDVQPLNFRTER